MRQPGSKSTQNYGAGLRQPVISSFFSQPSKDAGTGSEPPLSSGSPIDLTISEEEEPPTKKQKMRHRPISDSSTQRQSQSQHAPASRWCYIPSQSPEKLPMNPETKKRRELFSKQLLAENSSFVDVSEAPGHGPPSDHAGGEPDSSGADSDSEFKHLQELFARKTEQKKKRKATQERTSKKHTELGPSGEPYTALEQQVWGFLTNESISIYNE